MRILHLLSQTQITGAESFAHVLTTELEQLGHEVFYASDDLFLQKPSRFLKIPVDRAKGLQYFRSLYQLKKYLQANKIEVIHAHSRAAARLGSAARRGLKISLVTTFHGLHPASWSKKLRNIYGERTHAVCQKIKDWATQELWMDPHTIDVIGNPFLIPTTLVAKNLKFENLQLTYISRASGPKGQRLKDFLSSTLLEALSSIPGLQVQIFGVGKEDLDENFNKWLESEFSKKGLALDRLKILGKYQHAAEIFATTDVLMGSGRVAIEGLLRGCPVIVLGEHRFGGLVTFEAFKSQAQDNFGDVGEEYLNYSSSDFIKALHAATQLGFEEKKAISESAAKIYSVAFVTKNILRSYALAIFKRQHPKNIPVLMYHKVPDEDIPSQHRIFVNKKLFEKQMQWLSKNNFKTLHFADIKRFLDGEIDYSELPAKPILLTFDDGYADNLRNAAPILKKFNFKAVIYLLAETKFSKNTWDAYESDSQGELLSKEERQALVKNFDFEVGSHGCTHRHLTELSEPEGLKELQQSKQSLEDEFNTEVLSFAYPFGSRNAEVADWCKKSGYDFAVNTDQGGRYWLDDPFSIFRVNIFPEDKHFQIFKKSASWYRNYFRIKKGK